MGEIISKPAYKPGVTAIKAGEPLSIVVVAEGLSAILEASGVKVPKELLYPVVTLVFGIAIGIRNWRKHK